MSLKARYRNGPIITISPVRRWSSPRAPPTASAPVGVPVTMTMIARRAFGVFAAAAPMLVLALPLAAQAIGLGDKTGGGAWLRRFRN